MNILIFDLKNEHSLKKTCYIKCSLENLILIISSLIINLLTILNKLINDFESLKHYNGSLYKEDLIYVQY
jgi:hypothetical protein